MTSTDTDHFSFRPMELDDVSKIADWFLDIKDMAFFDRTLPIPLNADAMRESWKESLEYAVPPSAYWIVADDPEGQPAGVSGFIAINYIHGDAILPAFVGTKYRDLGLGTAMAAYAIDLAFNHFRLHRLTTFYRADNEAANLPLQKLGFTEEGRFRESWFANGRRNDAVIVGLLASEWSARKSAILDELERTSKLPLPAAFWDRMRG